MGEMVGAFGVFHVPGFTAWPEEAPADQVAALTSAFDRARSRIEALHPDALVIISPEHWTNFFLDNMPAFCVGVAAGYEGPIEEWLRVDRKHVAGHPELAQAILEDAMDAGIEPAFAHELLLDHGTIVPLHFLTPSMDVPVVPIILNCLQPPMPRAPRCYAFGQSIGRTVRRRSERVVVVASGGLSHSPGAREHGQINREWDGRVLELVRTGNGEELARYTEAEIAEGGTAGAEVRAWVTMLGAVGPAPAEILAYEPVPVFATGCAIAAMRLQE